MAVKSPPIKSPFVPLRHGDGDVDPDMLRQNFDRLSEAFKGLYAKLQINYTPLPSASPSGTLSVNGTPVWLGDDIYGDSSGSETVLLQWRLDAGNPTVPITFSLVTDRRSAVGAATFRLRVGGGDRTPDGTIVLASMQAETAAGFATVAATSTVPSPGGLQRLKLTVMSSATGSLAQIKDGYISLIS